MHDVTTPPRAATPEPQRYCLTPRISCQLGSVYRSAHPKEHRRSPSSYSRSIAQERHSVGATACSTRYTAHPLEVCRQTILLPATCCLGSARRTDGPFPSEGVSPYVRAADDSHPITVGHHSVLCSPQAVLPPMGMTIHRRSSHCDVHDAPTPDQCLPCTFSAEQDTRSEPVSLQRGSTELTQPPLQLPKEVEGNSAFMHLEAAPRKSYLREVDHRILQAVDSEECLVHHDVPFPQQSRRLQATVSAVPFVNEGVNAEDEDSHPRLPGEMADLEEKEDLLGRSTQSGVAVSQPVATSANHRHALDAPLFFSQPSVHAHTGIVHDGDEQAAHHHRRDAFSFETSASFAQPVNEGTWDPLTAGGWITSDSALILSCASFPNTQETADVGTQLAGLAVHGMTPTQKRLAFDEEEDNEENTANGVLETLRPPFGSPLFTSSDVGGHMSCTASPPSATAVLSRRQGRGGDKWSPESIHQWAPESHHCDPPRTARTHRLGERKHRHDRNFLSGVTEDVRTGTVFPPLVGIGDHCVTELQRRPTGLQLLRSRKRCLTDIAQDNAGSGTALPAETTSVYHALMVKRFRCDVMLSTNDSPKLFVEENCTSYTEMQLSQGASHQTLTEPLSQSMLTVRSANINIQEPPTTLKTGVLSVPEYL